MFEKIKTFASTFFVTGDPLIYGADVAIALTIIAIVSVLTYFKRWKWLWKEWLTTVDHKRIGIMYVIASLLMLFRGGVDALLMRTQLALPEMDFLSAAHYNAIFTTHGVIMILFMAMPLMFGLFNLVVPLQIGARDVAFPFLNAVSFWLFFWGAMLFNVSFVIGGSPDAGWLAYPPLSSLSHSPGVGQDFYIWGIQISGIGSLMTGINFIVTILKMRAPGMSLMKMPMFSWSVLASSLTIILAFPILTVTLALLFIDRYFGAHFFTLDGGGNPMMYINLIWMWGHPEVYIVILPAFGILSEVVATFSRKKLFGYKSMVFALMSISIVSFTTWAHHFFTMGSGADVNAFFAITTMVIAIPTGVKVFNWIFTMFRGKITFRTPMMWTMGFILCFVIGGMTGVLLSVAPADFQFHNSYFLIAHFHQTLIGGVAFAYFAALTYWWPKVFGFKLNEKLGKWAFWTWNIGFYICFMPQYALGLMGMTRRINTYGWDTGWWELNLVSTVGGFLMGIGFLFQVWQILHSIKFMERDTTGDPWDGRTLEWSIPSPAPHYNFAVIPTADRLDWWWEEKLRRERGEAPAPLPPLAPIHMPKNSGIPFVMSFCWFVAGFGLVFDWLWMAIPGLIGVAVCMLVHSFRYKTDYYIQVDEIRRTEAAARGGCLMAYAKEHLSGPADVHVDGHSGSHDTGHAGGHADGHADLESMRVTGFWLFLITDVILFSTLFATFIVLRGNTDGRVTGAELIELPGVIASTFILLTSSFTSGLALLAMNRGSRGGLIGWLAVTALLGASFIALEVTEFVHLVHEGATITTSAYWSSFYTLVGTHGVHVSIGLVWMLALMIQLGMHGITSVTRRKVNVIGLYWHFLDVVWIFLFTLVYLMEVM